MVEENKKGLDTLENDLKWLDQKEIQWLNFEKEREEREMKEYEEGIAKRKKEIKEGNWEEWKERQIDAFENIINEKIEIIHIIKEEINKLKKEFVRNWKEEYKEY